jgi:hypothetical protein
MMIAPTTEAFSAANFHLSSASAFFWSAFFFCGFLYLGCFGALSNALFLE